MWSLQNMKRGEIKWTVDFSDEIMKVWIKEQSFFLHLWPSHFTHTHARAHKRAHPRLQWTSSLAWAARRPRRAMIVWHQFILSITAAICLTAPILKPKHLCMCVCVWCDGVQKRWLPPSAWKLWLRKESQLSILDNLRLHWKPCGRESWGTRCMLTRPGFLDVAPGGDHPFQR